MEIPDLCLFVSTSHVLVFWPSHSQCLKRELLKTPNDQRKWLNNSNNKNHQKHSRMLEFHSESEHSEHRYEKKPNKDKLLNK